MQRSVKLLYWLEETPRSGMPWSRPRPSSPRPAPSSSTSCSRITRVLTEKVPYYSEKHQEMREGLISANQLRSWLEECTVATNEHPHPFPDWDFKARFPGMPSHARRAAMKEAIGKARAYLTALATWQKSGEKKKRPGLPGATDHPTDLTGSFPPGARRSQDPRPLCAAEGLRPLGGGPRRGQPTRHEPVLLPLRQEGGEVLLPERPASPRQMGKIVLVPVLPL